MFGDAVSFNTDARGNFYVTDPVSERISFFDDSGNSLRQIAVPDVFEDLFITSKGYYVSTRTIPLEDESGRSFKLVYHRFALMENGWLFVVAEIVADGDNLFDLFDEDGRYIGQFTDAFPADTWLFFKNGKAYAVAEKDGYKFVER